ncbi:uncharacterized protein [Gossypium hirsutum]|uniref:Uncharacterized protein n=1 Tax=Gossypium hirsutum TaxID=3635 RepID=A0A1U8P8U7_GOSHI|nr:uncharacterized protein LOC107956388 [Gossypium hirsutum]
MQATGLDTTKQLRGVQQPLKGHGQAKGSNGLGCGQRAPSKGAGYTGVRQPALVYVARHREDGDAPNVITSTFFIYNAPDIGSTHSYIACTVSETLGILVESTTSEVTVLSPLGQSVRVNKLFRDVPLEMVLRIVGDDEVVVAGEHQKYLSNVISTLKAKKLVRKGCKSYLAYLSVSDSGVSSVKDISTVKDFPDFFLDELLGLPSNREVEFAIELLPGIAPVSIALYRMALKELVELKA